MDAMHQSTGDDSYSDAAYYSQVGALATGLAAGVAGAMDYLTIESGTETKRTGNIHALLNLGALALTAANVMKRHDRRHHRGGSLTMSALAAAGVMVSGWFGGKLVYEQGMRVKGVDPLAGKPEIKPPGDALMQRAMNAEEKLLPTTGPVLN
jgi:uncharacterized membrane protein